MVKPLRAKLESLEENAKTQELVQHSIELNSF